MTVYIVETQAVFEDKPVAGLWEIAGVYATASGATKAAASMARVFLALNKPKPVRTREMQVQP